MSRFNRFFSIALADFRERTRSYGYLATLIMTTFAALLFVKLVDMGYVPMQFGKYRMTDNLNYLWTALVANESLLLSLVGFYLVKNSIDKDDRTTTGQLIAATPTSKASYIFGKAASNFSVLLSIIIALAIILSVMVFFRFRSTQLDIWPLYSTYFLIILPPVVFVSAVSILFDTIPLLRRGFGNITYFFIWVIVFVTIIASSATGSNTGIGIFSLFDMAGFSFFYQSTLEAAGTSFPVSEGSVYNMLKIINGHASEGFVWNGINWTGRLIYCRLFILLMSGAILSMASLIFKRFDTTREKGKGIVERMPDIFEQVISRSKTPAPTQKNFNLSVLPTGEKRFSLFHMIISEIRLMIKGMPWWWYTAAAGLVVTGAANSVDFSRNFHIASITWIWPTLVWSSMGARDKHCDTWQMTFSCAFPVRRQIPASFLAGVLAAFTAGSGMGIRFIVEGQWGGLLAWFAAVVFIPALALALGTLSGTSKLFEAVYLVFWYLGPVNRITILDYTGMAKGMDFCTQPLIYFAAAVVLLILAVFKRRRQVRDG